MNLDSSHFESFVAWRNDSHHPARIASMFLKVPSLLLMLAAAYIVLVVAIGVKLSQHGHRVVFFECHFTLSWIFCALHLFTQLSCLQSTDHKLISHLREEKVSGGQMPYPLMGSGGITYPLSKRMQK